MHDGVSYLWCYYNNAMGLCGQLSRRIEQEQTLGEDEAMCYYAMLALHAQHRRNILTTITPKEDDDGQA